MPRADRKYISADDLYRYKAITTCDLSPDGLSVVFALQSIDRKTEKKISHLWRCSTSDGSLQQMTFGKNVDREPKWSPDGTKIAFLSNRQDTRQPQLFILPATGGEAFAVTDLQGDIASFQWSPDSHSLAFQFRRKNAELLEMEKDAQKKELGMVSHRFDRVFFKRDEYGFLPKDRWHIWTVDTSTKKVNQITNHPVFDDLQPCWAPDGDTLVYISNHQPDPDFAADYLDLYAISASKGGEPRKLNTPDGYKLMPSISPNGRQVAFYSQAKPEEDWRNYDLWITPLDGSSPAVNLSEGMDLHMGESTLTDIGSPVVLPPAWTPAGDALYVQTCKHGSTSLYLMNIASRQMSDIVSAPGVVGSFAFDHSGCRLAYIFADFFDPGQIWFKELDRPTSARMLTHNNHDWMKKLEWGKLEEVWFKGADGNDLQGWILTPPDFDPSKKYPSIMEIHGGPLTQYGWFFMHEFHYLAAQGYVVYFCNPRGGRGYGEEHARAIWAAWGTVDYRDLMLWADYAAALPFIDRDRMGVTGGSYGGYMTDWIIGHTQRFKAAVTQRCVSNLVSLWGSSDFNWSFQKIFGGKPPYESLDLLWECSPMKHIGNARTPTLVIHNLGDLRCPVEQGEQVYTALKQLGVPTELVLFPDEPHGLSRVGRTDRRIVRLESICGWFDKYL